MLSIFSHLWHLHMHIFLGNLPVKVYQISAKYFTEKNLKNFHSSAPNFAQVVRWLRSWSGQEAHLSVSPTKSECFPSVISGKHIWLISEIQGMLGSFKESTSRCLPWDFSVASSVQRAQDVWDETLLEKFHIGHHHQQNSWRCVWDKREI